MNIKSLMKEIPYFKENNVSTNELYAKLSKARDILCHRSLADTHQYNREKVTGMWIFTHLTYEGAAQILIRSSIPLGTYERLLLHGEIYDYIGQDVVFDYDIDLLKGTQMIKGEQAELIEEIKNGRILTIYDKEREG